MIKVDRILVSCALAGVLLPVDGVVAVPIDEDWLLTRVDECLAVVERR